MGIPATYAGRPRHDFADLVRGGLAELAASVPLSPEQRRALAAIVSCRTAALGGHLEVCRDCGGQHPAYSSCRNRHCPKCQALAAERWIAARSDRLLPVRHFHVVFTAPAELRPLAQQAPELVYSVLLQAASATLLELGESRWQVRLGVTTILHTWTRDLRYHPHVHALVTAGGLTDSGQRFVRRPGRYLFPVKVMGELLRGKVLAALRDLHRHHRLPVTDPEFAALCARLARPRWVVYAKSAFRRVEHVLAYLGRYTHRVGLANSRLLSVTEDAVTLATKHGQSVTLTPLELLRRFVQHVLPAGFQKVRHYGLYASACVVGLLAQAHALLAPTPTPPAAITPPPPLTYVEHLRALTGRDVDRCPRCGGRLLRWRLEPQRSARSATARAPPHQAWG
jgi:hypothetical protein